jgi:hypothetical protein
MMMMMMMTTVIVVTTADVEHCSLQALRHQSPNLQ